MKNLILANWKMHFDVQEATEKALTIAKNTQDFQDKVDIVICPNFLAIPEIKKVLENSKIKLGAQNCSWLEEGALTGEVSPKVLAQYCDYIILGHSERRMHLYENDPMIAKKIDLVTNLGLKPVVCIGETLEEHDRGDINRLLSEIEEAFSLTDKEHASDVIIAYEPIWAISTSSQHTDEKVTHEYAEKVAEKIREKLKSIYDAKIAQEIRIIYGGSVNPENIEHLHCQPQITGYLVGGASLDPEKFTKIIESISK